MTEIIQPLSLGQQLKTAREAMNLTLAEVAQQTHLKKSHLEALEDDIFILANVPPAFVRGYVRNYVRFLRLPEELIGSVHYGEVTIPKETKRIAAPIPVKTNHKSQARWLKGLTWLILLGAIGMTLAWWWQEHQKDQASNEQLASSVELSPVAEKNESSDKIGVTIPVMVDNNVVGNAIEPVATNMLTAQNTEQSSEAIVLPPAVIEQTPSELVQEQQASSTQTGVEPTDRLSQTAVQTELVKIEPSQQDNQSEETAISNDELRIEITNANSWITVRGVKNKKLAEKLYNAGEILTFNGNEQYRLTVGAPANVKIYYKGQQVPLKVDGRVARFKLPLAN